MKKKSLALLLAAVMAFSVLPTVAGAEEFSDMPNDYSTEALEKAVENGLLSGDGNGSLSPESSLTRAQMATILVRALNAEKAADITEYTDITSDAWYADPLSKAVYAELFKGDGSSLNPDASITRQEVCVVVARLFAMDLDGTSALDAFVDKANIADWAQESVAACVEYGAMKGYGDNFGPADRMLRKDFAVMIDRLIKSYIDEAGVYTEVPEGSLVISVAGVTLKNVTISGDLVIADGVGEGDIVLDNVKVEGNTIVRGGGQNTVHVKGNSQINNITIAKVDGKVRVLIDDTVAENINVVNGDEEVIVEGDVKNLEVKADVKVVVKNANLESAHVTGDEAYVTIKAGSALTSGLVTGENSVIHIEKDAKATNVGLSETATASKIVVEKDAEVEGIVSNAAGSTVENSGKVSVVAFGEKSEGSSYVFDSDTKTGAIARSDKEVSLEVISKSEKEAKEAAAEKLALELAEKAKLEAQEAEAKLKAEAAAQEKAALEAQIAAATEAEKAALEKELAEKEAAAAKEAEEAAKAIAEQKAAAEKAAAEKAAAEKAAEAAAAAAAAEQKKLEDKTQEAEVVSPSVDDKGDITVTTPDVEVEEEKPPVVIPTTPTTPVASALEKTVDSALTDFFTAYADTAATEYGTFTGSVGGYGNNTLTFKVVKNDETSIGDFASLFVGDGVLSADAKAAYTAFADSLKAEGVAAKLEINTGNIYYNINNNNDIVIDTDPDNVDLTVYKNKFTFEKTKAQMDTFFESSTIGSGVWGTSFDNVYTVATSVTAKLTIYSETGSITYTIKFAR